MKGDKLFLCAIHVKANKKPNYVSVACLVNEEFKFDVRRGMWLHPNTMAKMLVQDLSRMRAKGPRAMIQGPGLNACVPNAWSNPFS